LQAKTIIKMVVSCLEEDRGRRPTIEDVAHMLVSVDEVSSPVVVVVEGDAQNLHASVYLH
jgi:hypothetical protein